MRLIDSRLRKRLASEHGFTMIAVLGVMVLASTLATVGFMAAQGDIHITQRDTDSKRAYYAARAGVSDFIHRVNQDTNFWQTCPSQAPTTLPGSGAGSTRTYSYAPVGANGQACDPNKPIATMIDTSTGTFSMKFTGTAGLGSSKVTRSLVASFRRDSPLDYLWYTIYETLDPRVYRPPDSKYDDCERFHRAITQPPPGIPARPSYCSEIDWIGADTMDGPMYTQDEYRVCGHPTFGRPGVNDKILAGGPDPGWYSSCSGSSPNVNGAMKGNADTIPLPSVNSRLKVDAATASQKIFGGATKIQLNGNNVTIDAAMESSNGGSTWSPSPQFSSSIDFYPIIYVDNLPGCTPDYTPYNVHYDSLPSNDPCGTAYVQGQYSSPLTIATADDIVVSNNITDANHSGGLPSGAGMLGLVANNFVRVMHGTSGCGSNSPSVANSNLTIEAAILALSHSFIVDNYDCGQPLNDLIVNGAIAQKFRGTVGTHNGSTVASGYAKKYTYDDRLHSQEPPYMFDIQDASWHIFRETLCIVGSDC